MKIYSQANVIVIVIVIVCVCVCVYVCCPTPFTATLQYKRAAS